jgi:hypothetical protein
MRRCLAMSYGKPHCGMLQWGYPVTSASPQIFTKAELARRIRGHVGIRLYDGAHDAAQGDRNPRAPDSPGLGRRMSRPEFRRGAHLAWPQPEILQDTQAAGGAKVQTSTSTAQSDPAPIVQTTSALSRLAHAFPLPWSAYVRLIWALNSESSSAGIQYSVWMTLSVIAQCLLMQRKIQTRSTTKAN